MYICVVDKRKEEYHKYLKSAEWIEFRASIIKKRGKVCEKCGATSNIQAHHLTYERIFVELETDIQLLCVDCHSAIHNKKRKKAKEKAKLRAKVKKKPKVKQKIKQAFTSPLEEKRKKLMADGKLPAYKPFDMIKK